MSSLKNKVVKQQLHGAALPYALVVSLILLLLILGLLLQFDLSSRLGDRNLARLRAINWFGKHDVLVRGANPFDLSTLGGDSVFTEVETWGAWGILRQRIVFEKDTFRRAVMIAQQWPAGDRPNLVIRNSPNGLGMLGKSKVVGNVQLSNPKVYPAYIGTRYFTGDQMVVGKVTELDAAADRQSENWWVSEQRLDDWYVPKPIDGYARVDTLYLDSMDTRGTRIHRSFYKPPLVLISGGDRRLQDIQITGHVILRSGGVISIAPSASLRDVIIQAPAISVETGSEIQAQLIAEYSLRVEQNAGLLFPSSALVMGGGGRASGEAYPGPAFALDKGARFYGCAVIRDPVSRKVELAEGSLFTGVLDCQGSMLYRGEVHGHLSAREFVLNLAGGVYKNIWVDTRIRREESGSMGPFDNSYSQSHMQYVRMLD